MWSVGCILGELIVGKAIFQGTSTLNQIEKVLELIGKPKQEDIESLESPHAATILSSINVSKKRSFHSFFPNASELALDLLRRLLSFNPNHRLTVEEALKHKYVEQFSSPDEEIVCDHLITIPMDDNTKFTVKEYRDAIYADIAKKKKEQRKKMQEKYLSQLGITPEMLEQQRLAQQQQQSQPTTEASSTVMKNSRSSNSQQSTSNYSKAEPQRDTYEKKQSYANTKSESLYAQPETQKPQSRGTVTKQSSMPTSSYGGSNAHYSSNVTASKTSSSAANQIYSSSYAADKKPAAQSAMMGSAYGKMGTTGASSGLNKKGR